MCFINPICENYLCVLDNCPWHNGRAGCLPAHSPGCPENQHIHSSHYLLLKNSLNPENIYIGQCVVCQYVCLSWVLGNVHCPMLSMVFSWRRSSYFCCCCCNVAMLWCTLYTNIISTRDGADLSNNLLIKHLLSVSQSIGTWHKHLARLQGRSCIDPWLLLLPHATIFMVNNPYRLGPTLLFL